jgi:outer membrane lipoprotein-sorting protein
MNGTNSMTEAKQVRRRMLALTAVIVFAASVSTAQTLTAEKILQNVKSVSDKVKDYTAQLTASVHMERLKIPEMKVRIYFKQPDKMHIESSGFTMLPKEGLFLNPSLLLERFDAQMESTEKNGTSTTYVLQLTPKPDKQGSKRKSGTTKIWVDAGRWLVTKLESGTQAGGIVTVVFQQTLLSGQFWLPEKITADFDVPARKDEAEDDAAPRRQSRPVKGNVTMMYSDFKVNEGIDDALFEPKKGEKGR